MRFFYITLIVFSLAKLGFAQESEGIKYTSSFEKAKEIALEKDKDILLVFSGSDWCKPCVILDKTILQDSLFIAYANKNLIVYKADFPRKKKNKLKKEIEAHNNKLASIYNKKGEFPKVILFSKNAELKSVLIYNHMGVDEFINQIEKY